MRLPKSDGLLSPGALLTSMGACIAANTPKPTSQGLSQLVSATAGLSWQGRDEGGTLQASAPKSIFPTRASLRHSAGALACALSAHSEMKAAVGGI
mmetsp:Transcript_32170/g.91278  ORF Transcript_32170/g.91278 Transcript_32170/m.91278 type:complete len:96 (+) Transcript_32170:720-1007(+)